MAKARTVENLDCAAGAREGMQRVLETRRAEVFDYSGAALDFSDIKGVHAMRVATRRLRGVLRDFRPHLSRRVPQRKLKRLADALGAVRDQDVAIKRLEKLAEEAEENVAAGVRQLIEGREQQRAGARLKLEKALRDERLRKLSDKLGAKIARAIGLVEGDKEDDSSRPARPEFVSELTFIEAGREMVGARFEELADTADSLFRPQAIEEIHRTRIRAKRARYAVELFASCRGDALQPFALEIEGLQKSLGELHDLDVWIEELGERLAKLHGRAGKSAPGDESLRAALVWLLARFAVERAEHYSDALTLWHEWQTTDFAGRLMSAFDEKPQGEDAPS